MVILDEKPDPLTPEVEAEDENSEGKEEHKNEEIEKCRNAYYIPK